MQAIEYKVIHDAADAAYKADAHTITDILISGGHLVKTVFAPDMQRFAAIQALEYDENNADAAKAAFQFSLRGQTVNRVFTAVRKTLLVPEVLYQDQQKSLLFSKQHSIDEGEIISSYPVKSLAARLLFAFQGDRFIEGEAQKIPIDAAWLEMLCLGHKSTAGKHAHLHQHGSCISVAMFQGPSLVFYNTFNTVNAEEVLYYLMFAGEQLGFNPQQDDYWFSGWIRRGDDTHNLLTKYIRSLKPEDRPPVYRYAIPVRDVPGHIFYNAFCTPVCAL